MDPNPNPAQAKQLRQQDEQTHEVHLNYYKPALKAEL